MSTELLQACKDGDFEFVKNLLDIGARVTIVDEFGRSPLYFATKYGRDSIVELLLQDPNIQRHDIKNALEVATNIDIINLLKNDL
jgi:ankyrin repeat protein